MSNLWLMKEKALWKDIRKNWTYKQAWSSQRKTVQLRSAKWMEDHQWRQDKVSSRRKSLCKHLIKSCICSKLSIDLDYNTEDRAAWDEYIISLCFRIYADVILMLFSDSNSPICLRHNSESVVLYYVFRNTSKYPSKFMVMRPVFIYKWGMCQVFKLS